MEKRTINEHKDDKTMCHSRYEMNNTLRDGLPQSTAAELVNADAVLCISSQVDLEAHPLDHLANLPISQQRSRILRNEMQNNTNQDLQDST